MSDVKEGLFQFSLSSLRCGWSQSPLMCMCLYVGHRDPIASFSNWWSKHRGPLLVLLPGPHSTRMAYCLGEHLGQSWTASLWWKESWTERWNLIYQSAHVPAPTDDHELWAVTKTTRKKAAGMSFFQRVAGLTEDEEFDRLGGNQSAWGKTKSPQTTGQGSCFGQTQDGLERLRLLFSFGTPWLPFPVRVKWLERGLEY